MWGSLGLFCPSEHLQSCPWTALSHGTWKKVPFVLQVSYRSPSLLQMCLRGAAVAVGGLPRKRLQASPPVELGCFGDERAEEIPPRKIAAFPAQESCE